MPPLMREIIDVPLVETVVRLDDSCYAAKREGMVSEFVLTKSETQKGYLTYPPRRSSPPMSSIVTKIVSSLFSERLFYAIHSVMVYSPKLLVILASVLCITILCVGCREGLKEKGAGTAPKDTPAAEVKQTIPAPSLGQPSTQPAGPETEVVSKAAVGEMPSPPKGPITVLPPAPETVPPEPQVPPATTAPLTTIPGPETTTQKEVGESGIRTMPASGVTPPALPSEAERASQAQAVPYEPKVVKAKTNIEVIIDASGSMAAVFGATNTSKLDMVRQALFDVLLEVKSQQADFPRNVAIRVFGAKTWVSEGDRKDTQLIVAMGEPDLDVIRKSLDAVEAKGMSPIAFALTEAASDFPPEAQADRVIVLVSDGADNADGDPCAATLKIEEGMTKTTMQVIAFDTTSEDHGLLECIAKNGEGELFLARNENELRSSLDQAINSTLPYNLKLSALAGSIPIPFDFTVFKAGTQETIRHDKSFGTKLLKLAPGTFDILIEYASSHERRKPSKMLKGVDILASTKVEQAISFDLGQLSLTSFGNDGLPAASRFDISRAGTTEPIASLEAGAESKVIFLTPGQYDIRTSVLDDQAQGYSLTETGVEIKVGEAAERTFRFQKGSVAIKGVTTQKESMPFIFQVYKSGQTDQVVASGALPVEGGGIPLMPGIYDIIVTATDPKLAASPRTKISGVDVRSQETTEITATFEMGVMKLSAVDGQGNKIPAQFVIRDHETQMDVASVSTETGEPLQLSIPPGSYDIVASSLRSVLEPKPSVPVEKVAVTADKPAEQVIKFILGTLRLRGRNAKEQAIPTQFTIYRAGTNEKVSTAPASGDWMVFDLAPGIYDALAVNTTSAEQPQPMIWLRDIVVEDGKTMSHEAIYTAGKLKIIGRGPNSQIITCHFKVFEYGADREIINGMTGSDWEVFEIQPGKYYLEAGFHDDIQSVMLKKWINITVGENEVVEEVLRF